MARNDEIAAKFAELHPGFTLVDYEEVGLPYFELRLDVMAQKRHQLPVIDEYVLRLADLGLRSTEQVGDILGLEPSLVRGSVLSLLQSDYVDYAPARNGRELSLTAHGSKVLEERMEQVPERTEIRIGFDRLLWKLSARWMPYLRAPKMFKEQGIQHMPPRVKRRPDASDIDLVELNTVLAELPRRSKVDLDVLALLNVRAQTRCLSALLLVFVADDQSTLRASFIVDEHHSPEHDRAFEEIGGLTRLGRSLADPASLSQDRPILPDDLEDLRPQVEVVDRLEERLRATATALEAAVEEIQVDRIAESVSRNSTTRERLASREREVDDLRREVESLKAERASLPIRPLPTFEHRRVREDALDRTERRLLIISPWVKSAVVDEDFASGLLRLCKAGVQMHIGYGIKRNDREGHDAEALGRLRKLAGRFPNLILRELGDTHAKILVWDNTLVVTSFNWLSFRGDRNRQYRQEEGTLIRDAAYVDREYARHRGTIEAS
jgi:hypothetical protein